MNLYSRIICVCAMAAMVCVADAQIKRPTRIQRDSVDDLEKIWGICGCTNCGGRLEHNDPYDENDPNQFQIVTRWTATTMSGGGLGQGTPTILTWSIIPDGTDANGAGGFVPSNMIGVFDNLFNEANAGSPDLTNRNWFSLIEQALDRWGEVSGLEYVYEPNDDGLANFGAGGAVGVRGDVRIGGFTIDGMGNVLAFNQFPNVGDMAIDTSDTGLYGNPAQAFRLFRNVFTHEQGHGIGFAHVESNNAGFLMEPFIQPTFDGPQLDDIRAAHRNYGDVFEKSNNFNGNNTIADATDLGLVADGGSVSIGANGATGTQVGGNEINFVSVDDNSDTDFYRFTIDEISFVDITLDPVGATYNQSAQGGGGGVPLNSSNVSNLTLGLFDSGGGAEAIVNSGGLGVTETITDQLLIPGDYFIRVTGSANNIQLYTLAISSDALHVPTATGPTVVTTVSGAVSSGTVGDLESSDNQYLELQPEVPGNPVDEPIVALFTFFSPDIIVSEITFDYEGSGNTPNVDQTLSVFNNDTGMMEELDSREVTLADSDFRATPDGSAQRFVSFPSGLVLLEMKYEPTGLVLFYPWTIRIDELLINTLD